MRQQTIVTPEGTETVLLAKEDYDRLVAFANEALEDAADRAAFDAALADADGSKLLSVEESAAVLRRGRGEQ